MEWFNWVEQVLRNYAQFNGRSRRKEYWKEICQGGFMLKTCN